MFKKIYKKTLGYKLFLGFLIGIGVVILAVLLMLTPIGSGILKKVIESKIDRYIPGAEITYLDYGVNNFSLAAQKGHNIIKVYGAIFPLNAMFEGNVENLSELSPYYQGKMNLSGKIYIDRDDFVIEGMSFFANGYMNFKVKLNDDVSIHAKGSDFDLKKLLYILKIDYPWVEGKTDIQVNKEKNSLFNVEFKTIGEYKNRLDTEFKAITNVKMKNKKDLTFESNINADIGNIALNGQVQKDKWNYRFNAQNIDLLKLKPILLYPFHTYTNFTGVYESSNDVLKFKGKNFRGFADSRIEMTFKMDGKEFFDYIGVMQLLNGVISGTIKINEKFGTFDIVSNDTKFIKNSFTNKIRYLTGIDLSKENTGKVFFKGHFDKNQTVFDMLSTNQNISLSVKKGKFTYPDKYEIVLYLRKGNNVFKLLLKNGNIRVLEKRDFRERDNKILVF
ncbi:hypothetical protein NAMH_1701 [Nautilia profundicola AmH]|uniref:DUF3971 domain-containing protein n=1 Tax=Nautilia profundicola (strain ATCC BAA-1463 / DSM 18972 / AmH) TaxID=598659 RepID=B9L6U3_NAUPA|nr:hypothetical protein [Nautilia profundicola]ACM92697.1 hypothetical protein NAMH_1701 [Nautilia profundicola AmH]